MITLIRQVVVEPDPALEGDNGYRWLRIAVGASDVTVPEYFIERVPLGAERVVVQVDAETFRDVMALALAGLR